MLLICLHAIDLLISYWSAYMLLICLHVIDKFTCYWSAYMLLICLHAINEFTCYWYAYMLLICLHAIDVHDFHDTVTAMNSLIDSLFLSHKLSVNGLRRVKTEVELLRAVLHPCTHFWHACPGIEPAAPLLPLFPHSSLFVLCSACLILNSWQHLGYKRRQLPLRLSLLHSRCVRWSVWNYRCLCRDFYIQT